MDEVNDHMLMWHIMVEDWWKKVDGEMEKTQVIGRDLYARDSSMHVTAK